MYIQVTLTQEAVDKFGSALERYEEQVQQEIDRRFAQSPAKPIGLFARAPMTRKEVADEYEMERLMTSLHGVSYERELEEFVRRVSQVGERDILLLAPLELAMYRKVTS